MTDINNTRTSNTSLSFITANPIEKPNDKVTLPNQGNTVLIDRKKPTQNQGGIFQKWKAFCSCSAFLAWWDTSFRPGKRFLDLYDKGAGHQKAVDFYNQRPFDKRGTIVKHLFAQKQDELAIQLINATFSKENYQGNREGLWRDMSYFFSLKAEDTLPYLAQIETHICTALMVLYNRVGHDCDPDLTKDSFESSLGYLSNGGKSLTNLKKNGKSSADHPRFSVLFPVIASLRQISKKDPQKAYEVFESLLPPINKSISERSSSENSTLQLQFQGIRVFIKKFYDFDQTTVKNLVVKLKEKKLDLYLSLFPKEKLSETGELASFIRGLNDPTQNEIIE